jgi:hypothetical protein
MPRLDGVSVIAIIVIASFAIDRIVTGLLFLLSLNKRWSQRYPDPALTADPALRATQQNRLKVWYFTFAAILAIPVWAGIGQVRLLESLGFPTNRLFDVIVTGLILVGGSDRVAEVLKPAGARGAGAKAEPAPITIQGSLVIEDRNSGQSRPLADLGPVDVPPKSIEA